MSDSVKSPTKKRYLTFRSSGRGESAAPFPDISWPAPLTKTLGILMNERYYESMARMASETLHKAFIENGTKDQYLLPEELFNDLLDSLRWLILHSNDPLKERLLNLYVYCIRESDKVDDENLYGSPEWVNVRTAVKNFLIHLAKFDFEAWERKELANA